MRLREWARLPEWQRAYYLEPGTRHDSLPPRMLPPDTACSICGEIIWIWQPFNWDHTIPMGSGGAKGRKNKALAHLLCNAVKGNRHPFSLKTPEEREAARLWLKPFTWERLLKVWAGEGGSGDA